jgi:hypothetical protein
MSLENVTADASLERNEYHKLALHQLDKLDDAEALYQIASRRDLGWDITFEAVARGHAVALGICFLHDNQAERCASI